MAKKCQKFVPAPLLAGLELNPGPGHGPNWSEEMSWRIVLKWKDEKKGTPAIANNLVLVEARFKILFKNIKKVERSMTGRDTILKQIYSFSVSI